MTRAYLLRTVIRQALDRPRNRPGVGELRANGQIFRIYAIRHPPKRGRLDQETELRR